MLCFVINIILLSIIEDMGVSKNHAFVMLYNRNHWEISEYDFCIFLLKGLSVTHQISCSFR